MCRPAAIAALVLLASACTRVPPGAYFPPRDERTAALAHTLFRAAQAAGDDPAGYSFALVASSKVQALSGEEGVFYFSEALAAQPAATVDALVAQAVAHEVLGHAGKRRVLSIGLSVGFTAVGFVVPGLGLADFLVNPIVVRAFGRDQEIAADRRAVEILRTMGHAAPRRTLADALRAAAAVNGSPRGWLFAREPDLEERLAALEPLEPPVDVAARAPEPGPR